MVKISYHIENLDVKGKQGNEPENPNSFIFSYKKGSSGGIPNPQPPAFKAVALPTEPWRQPSWLGSNHTSYARQSV